MGLKSDKVSKGGFSAILPSADKKIAGYGAARYGKRQTATERGDSQERPRAICPSAKGKGKQEHGHMHGKRGRCIKKVLHQGEAP